MAEFTRITTLDSLREGTGRNFTVGEREIAVFLVAGEVFAVENLCPHQHVPVLSEGALEGTVLTCPMHGWRFDLASGRQVDASSRLTKYETRIEGRDVFVAIPEQEDEPWW